MTRATSQGEVDVRIEAEQAPNTLTVRAIASLARLLRNASSGAFLRGRATPWYRHDMELLVYVRNHGGRRLGSTYVGAAVGEAPMCERLEMRAPLTSLAEFRVDADVEDPVAELREAVRQVFTIIGPAPHGRPTYVSRPDSAIFVVLEDGFDTMADVMRDLAEMLALCSPKVRRAASAAIVDGPSITA